MIKIVLMLAGAALVATGAGAAPKKAPPAKPKVKAKARPAAAAAAPVVINPSPDTQRVAAWIAVSGDNRKLPYAILDKNTASLILYDAKGKPLAQVPTLIGIAPGDDATPGVGSKKLGEIGPAEKTTPAGRFLAKFGYAYGQQRVLWVDYANSVAIHPIPGDAAKKEKRRERMLSETPDDNRITFGCINVPRAFFGNSLRPLFQKNGGYVYVLPDSKPLEDVFPRLRVHALTAGA
ncbi:hypothetical protein [Sphingomonas sp.]|uniref:hypothetical protein n=1 Tax=Sphingomonas sp. TaxID=28214 RepID=UPI002604C8BE|nr:hypothetical protein [Sphingomonas sp.]MDF2494927.1 hypothetical protein [Sphingomonas sp.]